jgi:uncharacterized protein (TIGR02265 family)
MPVFVEPPWDAPLDGDTYLRAVPPQATLKGVFTAYIVNTAKGRGIRLAAAADRYQPFLDYPLVDHMRVVLEAAPIFFPDLSLRQALRKMGRAAVGVFLTTTTGKAALAGLTQPDMVPLAMRALVRLYAVTVAKPTPTIELEEESDTSCILHMSDTWFFLDSHHVGIVEGLCRMCGVRADVRIWTEGLASGQFHVRWTPGPPSSMRSPG